MKNVTNFMDYYNTPIKNYIVPIYIHASKHWFTLHVDVTSGTVNTIDRYNAALRSKPKNAMHKEARVWFSKYFGLCKLFLLKDTDSTVPDDYFSPSDINYDGYSIGGSNDDHHSSLYHCHVNVDTEQTDGNNCTLWVLCDIIGVISGKDVVQHDLPFF